MGMGPVTCKVIKRSRAVGGSRSPDMFEYIAVCDDFRPAGTLEVRKFPVRNLCADQACNKDFRDLDVTLVRAVEHIEVVTGARRRGIATMLYEAAAKDACRAAEPLVSYYRTRGAKSAQFWKKQKGKARAEVVGSFFVASDAKPGKTARGRPIYAHDCAAGTSFAGLCTKTTKRATKKRRR